MLRGTRKMGSWFGLALLWLVVCWCWPVFAGDLNPGSGPETSGSQMYTVQDLYNRLQHGTPGTKADAFVLPDAGPEDGAGATLNSVMGVAPARDDADGARPEDVLAGKTFWGLSGTFWGPRTGTMPHHVDTVFTPGTTNQPIPVGYHVNSSVPGAPNLLPENIKSGVEIFGVTGTALNFVEGYPPPAPTAGKGEGVAWPDPRFEIEDRDHYRIIHDHLTGLMWHGGNPDDRLSVRDFRSLECEADWHGPNHLTPYDDWRVPSFHEVMSLFDWSQFQKDETQCHHDDARMYTPNYCWLIAQGFPRRNEVHDPLSNVWALDGSRSRSITIGDNYAGGASPKGVHICVRKKY